MSTGTKSGVRRRSAAPPIFITKSELARTCGPVDTATIDRWVRDGTFPPPHSRPGERTALWLRKHFDQFVETGRWPEEAYPSPG